jgi:Flp pilus assembly pilin Flp
MNDDSAATAVEYALITACISLALIVVLPITGFALAGTFSRLFSALGNGWIVVSDPPIGP